MQDDSAVYLCLMVDDYDKTIYFYCAKTMLFDPVVNLNLGQNNRNIVLRYEKPKFPFGIVVRLATTPIMSELVGNQGGDDPLFVLPVDDCLDSYEKLLRAGCTFDGTPFQLPYGC